MSDIKREAQGAIAALDACNLSGVVHSMSRAMSVIWQEADRVGKGTDYANTHPIAWLYALKVAELTGLGTLNDSADFTRNYRACQLMADGEAGDAIEAANMVTLAAEVNWESPDLYCNECGERIESSYAEDEVTP